MVVVVVRGRVFENPNSVLQDLTGILYDNEAAFSTPSFVEACRKTGHIAIVLIARNDLQIAQASSPVTLPSWFPLGADTTVSTLIRDLTWTADAALSADEAQFDLMCSLLFELDSALAVRLEGLRGADCLIWPHIRIGDESLTEFLGSAELYRRSIQSPEDFRPSARDAASLVARIWSLGGKSSPTELMRFAESLASDLRVPIDVLGATNESLIGTLCRPGRASIAPPTRWARNLIMTVCATCQFVTVSAHADNYRKQPIALIRAASFDLRRALDSSISSLEGWA